MSDERLNQNLLESDREKLKVEESKLQEAKNQLRANNEAGGRYGVSIDLWEQMTPEQRRGIADIYLMVDPKSAIIEGYREIDETDGHLTLSNPDSTK